MCGSVCDLLDPGMLCFLCLQPAVDYHGLAVTGRRRVTQAGAKLLGLCHSEGRLYVAEGQQEESGRWSYSLTVHSVQSDSGQITRLDTLTLLGADIRSSLCPRVDRHSSRVFFPCRDGVTVARLYGDRLVREMTLTCVRMAFSVDVMSPDTVYVVDRDTERVHLVNITDDRKILTLEKPDTVRGWPERLAVLGDSVMVCYSNDTLVVYRHGSPIPVRGMQKIVGLNYMPTVSTDCLSNYIVTQSETRYVHIIDSDGERHHSVYIPDSYTDSDTVSLPTDCAVVNRQLWVGCSNGDIVIMSS